MEMTTTPRRRQPEVHRLTPEELEAAEKRLLHECGFTKEELEEQARQGRFETETAKRAWFSLF